MPNFEGAMSEPEILVQQVSECSVLCKCGDGISLQTNIQVHQLAEQLSSLQGVADLLPAYNSLLIRFHDPGHHLNTVRTALSNIVFQQKAQIKEDLVHIPVCFHPELRNDLNEVSKELHLDIPQLIQKFCAEPYRVFMVGFLPGFPYLGTLPEKLQIPRRSQTRTIQAGAVAIAGAQAGIYPAQSPGGWHVLGYTPLQMFNAATDPPALLRAGQQVKFIEARLDEYRKAKEEME